MRRILVALDGSPLAEAIVEPVRVFSTRLGADIVLCHVVAVPEAAPDQTTPAAAQAIDLVVTRERKCAESYLESTAQGLRDAGVTVRTVTAAGDPATEIVRLAEREGADFIAIATHGRSGIGRWLYGSVADAVLHSATTPIFLLRAPDGPTPPFDVRRVVVGLDGSEVAERALPTAEEIARRFHVPLAMVRVVETSTLAFAGDPAAGVYVDYQRILEMLRDGAAQYLDACAAGVRRRGITVETIVAAGSAADELVAQARVESGTLLVLGTHGRSGWRAAALGSVARRVALLATSAVFLVRGHGAEPTSTKP
ncbi:MAG TPA: universal stress protein [Candidatus Binatia bacterium]|jgi:nucleotide-binding universal stress UspA family protein